MQWDILNVTSRATRLETRVYKWALSFNHEERVSRNGWSREKNFPSLFNQCYILEIVVSTLLVVSVVNETNFS